MDAQTGLDYLNARYYNSTQKQFLSEDPVFWSSQDLSDPQSFNAYSYSNDNPINRKDPSGKCVWDGCVVEAAATFGAVGGVGVQAYTDYQTGGFSQRSAWENVKVYSLAAGGGALVAGAGAAVGVEAAGLNLAYRLGLSALTSGTLTAGQEVGTNYFTNQKTDPGSVIVDSAVAALTDGTLQLAPGTRGVLPKTYGAAMDILKKAHATRSGTEAFVGASMSMTGSGAYQYLRTNYGTGSGFTGSGLIGNNSFSGSGTPNAKALGIGNSTGSFIGTYNFGSGTGTYNFGTGRWVK